ncbi:hypothetical protein KDX22_23455, partial [Burkholderia cenocepacia]
MSNVSKSPAPTRANTPSAKHPDGAADAREQQGTPAGKPAPAPRGPRNDERRGDARQPAAKGAP